MRTFAFCFVLIALVGCESEQQVFERVCISKGGVPITDRTALTSTRHCVFPPK